MTYTSEQIRAWIRQEIRELFDDNSDSGHSNPNHKVIKKDLYEDWIVKYKVKSK